MSQRPSAIRRGDAGRALACAVAALVGVLALCTGALADEIRLRSSVVLEPDRPVVVSDVAVLTGDEAMKGASAVVAPSAAELPRDAAGRGTVTIARVREALSDAGVMVARIAMSGSTCVVRINGGASPQALPEPVIATPPPAPIVESTRAYAVVGGTGPATVRTRVIEAIARTYGVEVDAVRIIFDDRDKALLDLEEAGRTVIVRPATTGNSARPQIEVRVVTGERVVESGMITADIEIWRSVVFAAGDIARREEIQPGMVREEERWVAPGSAPIAAHVGEVEGQRAVKRLRMGELVCSNDIEGAIAVKRGELVVVECVRNGISLQAKARAMADGCIGDRVECRVGDSKKTFIGTVDAVGRVVVVLGG